MADLKRVLTVNAGSTSLKCERYALDPATATLDDPGVPERATTVALDDLAHEEIALLTDAVDAIAHRFVRLPENEPAVIALDDAALARIGAVSADAPLHNAKAIAAVERFRAARVQQYAVSDSAFHRTLSAAASTYALPAALRARGLHRVGYHGLNHEYVAHRAARLAGHADYLGRVVSLHLGGGSSLCAIDHFRSVDTTMGFTPLEGVPMATRSGSIDPGLLIHVLREGTSVDALSDMLEHQSGLLGLSETTGDMQALLAASDDERAQLAIDVFVWRVRAALGAMLATLGGADVIAFSGGIGEHAPLIRQRILDGAAAWGAILDDEANVAAHADAMVQTGDSAMAIAVVTAREGWNLARSVALARR